MTYDKKTVTNCASIGCGLALIVLSQGLDTWGWLRGIALAIGVANLVLMAASLVLDSIMTAIKAPHEVTVKLKIDGAFSEQVDTGDARDHQIARLARAGKLH